MSEDATGVLIERHALNVRHFAPLANPRPGNAKLLAGVDIHRNLARFINDKSEYSGALVLDPKTSVRQRITHRDLT